MFEKAKVAILAKYLKGVVVKVARASVQTLLSHRRR